MTFQGCVNSVSNVLDRFFAVLIQGVNEPLFSENFILSISAFYNTVGVQNEFIAVLQFFRVLTKRLILAEPDDRSFAVKFFNRFAGWQQNWRGMTGTTIRKYPPGEIYDGVNYGKVTFKPFKRKRMTQAL